MWYTSQCKMQLVYRNAARISEIDDSIGGHDKWGVFGLVAVKGNVAKRVSLCLAL